MQRRPRKQGRDTRMMEGARWRLTDEAQYIRTQNKVASLGSPGVDELRWIRPVRPGDSLRSRVSVLDALRSRSKSDRGIVRTLVAVLNQNGDIVMSLKALNMLRCRPPDAA